MDKKETVGRAPNGSSKHQHSGPNKYDFETFSAREAASLLQGDITGRNRVLCPGPGHSRLDRSLSVTFDSSAPDGFLVHSFAGDDWRDCRDHVHHLLGLEQFTKGVSERGVQHAAPRHEKFPLAGGFDSNRTEQAVSIWREAVALSGYPRRKLFEGQGRGLRGERA